MKRRGFTLIEIAIVMVILGLIIGLGIPMMRMLMKSNKLHEDRNTVAEAKAALIGYAYEHGSFPNPDMTGIYRLLPFDILGVRETDSHGDHLIYDVNNQLLKTATSDNMTKFCNNVSSEMSANHPPKISYGDGKIASVVFVVISRGSNYKPDDLNKSGAEVSGGNRIYDNPSHPYSKDYDDIVAAYSFGELEKWCSDNGYFNKSAHPSQNYGPGGAPGYGNSGKINKK